MNGIAECDALVKFRERLADPGFLRQTIYTEQDTSFRGSTYRYLITVKLPDLRETVVSSLLDQTSIQPTSTLVNVLTHFVRQLPQQVCTLVQLPERTPPEESVRTCVAKGEVAIADSLLGQIPYAWFFGIVDRYLRTHGCDCPTASDAERYALFANYQFLYKQNARKNCPELWDTERGHYVYDSRGASFARQFILELNELGWLNESTRFLDVGHGVGTMPIAAALWSAADAWGIESQLRLHAFSNSFRKRITRKCPLLANRVNLIAGDIFHVGAIPINEFDVLYLYSPIGHLEIPLDPIVKQMKLNSVMITERLPEDNLHLVRIEPKICELFALRRIA